MAYSIRAERYYGQGSHFNMPSALFAGIDPTAPDAVEKVMDVLSTSLPRDTVKAQIRVDVVQPITHRRKVVVPGGVMFHGQDFLVFYGQAIH